MKFSPIPLTAAVASMLLLLSAPGHAQDKDAIPAPAAVMAAQTAEPTRVPGKDAPRTAGKKPCRKPSGELVVDRQDSDDEFSDFDKR